MSDSFDRGEPGRRFETITILGMRVHRITAAEAADLIGNWIESGDRRPRFVINTGFHGLWVGHRDASFKRLLNDADLFTPDGVAVEWLSRAQGKPFTGRARGVDLMDCFFRMARQKGYRSYFYGDTAPTLANLRNALSVRYPGHVVAGTASPPFRELTPQEDEEAIRHINAARPDVLWVGLGLPKQERWIAAHLDRLDVPVVMGVGACFRFYSGDLRTAPRWVARSGFEWAWRLLAEPRKLWRRDLIDGPRFLTAALIDAWRVRRKHPAVADGA